jgi:integrase
MRGRRGDSAYLFSAPGKHDHDVPMRCLKEALDRARNAAGIPDFTFRDCRNHFISQGVMGGIDFMTIAKWVGHKDGGILVGKVYGHLSDEHSRKQAMKLMFK